MLAEKMMASEDPDVLYRDLMDEIESGTPDAEARLQLAAAMFKIGSADGAETQLRLNALQRAVRLDPFTLDYRLALANTEYAHGLIDSAIKEYRRVLKFWPDSQRLNLHLGEALLAAGNISEARGCFEKVSADGEHSLQRAFNLIECDLREAKRPEDWSKILHALEGLDLFNFDACITFLKLLGLSLEEFTELDQKEADKLLRSSAKRQIAHARAASKGDAEAEKIMRDINQATIYLQHNIGILTVAQNNPQDYSGLYIEKCLKIATECDNQELRQRALHVAQKKLGQKSHPALQLLERVARQEPLVPGSDTSAFEGMLLAYRLTQEQPITTDGAEERLKSLLNWQTMLDNHGQNWPGLQAAYIASLDEWAHQAYSRHSIDEASALWGEIERLSPETPEVLHNLALISTRLKDEQAYEWYWQRATTAWILHSEMMPAARGYKAELIQKHRAFLEGAQTKLQTMRTWQELLELGEIWAQEVLGYFTLQQLEFRNPLFQCGVQSQDFRNAAERDELLEIGYQSLEAWLKMAADHYGLPEHSALLATWRDQAEAAYTKAFLGTNAERYRGYEDEAAAFQLHRELLASQYILLLFQVLHKLGEKIDLGHPSLCESYKKIAIIVLSFPHRLLKPDVLKVVQGMEADTDIQHLARNIALRPWLEAGKKHLEDGQAEKAILLVGNGLSLAPDFIPGMFLLAQCHAAQENFDRAYKILEKARGLCKPDDEILEHIQTFASQMEIARINKRLKVVHQYLDEEKPADAVRECRKVVLDFPENAYVQFILAQALVADLEITEAKTTLQKVLKLSKDDKKLTDTAQKNLDELDKYRDQIILSKAVPKMEAKEWGAALILLAKGTKLRPREARVTFYAAVCHARMGDAKSAEDTAKLALRQIKAGEATLHNEINTFRKQIPLMVIEEEFQNAQSAMEKEEWRSALSYLNAALKKAPEVLMVHFYKVLCHFRLEEWNAAEKYAQEALPLCKPDDKNIRDQLKLVIEQVPLARVKKEMDQAQAAIEKERWKEALGYLNKALQNSPKNLPALFYKALCQFRLKEWKDAEKTARRALKLCGSNDDRIEEQLEIILEQIPLAQVKGLLDEAQEAIRKENWILARAALDPVLGETPKHKVALFLSALVYFRSGDYRMAKRVADNAIDACDFFEDTDLISQLEDLKSAIEQAESGPVTNKIAEAIKAENYFEALKEINNVYRNPSNNPEAIFLTQVCFFRMTMDSINSGSHKPSQSDFVSMENALKNARKLAKGNQSLISQIDALADNIDNVRGQLRRAGIR